jgi:amino acid adenylation domain-containing protein
MRFERGVPGMKNQSGRKIADVQSLIRLLSGSAYSIVNEPPELDPEVTPIDLVAAIARSQPDAVALRLGTAELTYQDMMARVKVLADAMAEAGVGVDVPVGVCLDRTFDYIIAILAASLAGGAFLPLDPVWPEDRLRFVLDDARAPVLMTSPDRAEQLDGPGRTVLSPTARPQRSNRTRPRVTPSNLAYIIYTSGSTGEPKGVEITQGNLLHLIRSHRDIYRLTCRDHASCVAGLGFDAAVWEIWPYLAVGATVSLADEAVRSSSEALRRWLVEARISMAFVPTPLAEPMLSARWPDETALRYLLTGGDTLHVHPAEGLPFAVVNNYGPTECTVLATAGVVPPSRDGLPSIGRPIAGARIHILDPQGSPVGPGELGEIFIGGKGVGRGYRNRPALTAENFVADPFAPHDPTARLYRTGDLGCWLPDGQIGFHGRRDNQIKIRGYRVELDEISAALDAHPMVAQSAVIASGEGADMRLVAYVVPTPNAVPEANELHAFLGTRLPEYMLPSAFVGLAALPLTASGKLDRTALPVPTISTQPAPEEPAPASGIETRLARIIAEVLGIEHVAADNNFFLLGGHSLLGAQVVLKVRDEFGSELTLRDLFQTQTVTKLAARIEQRIVEQLQLMTDADTSRLLSAGS